MIDRIKSCRSKVQLIVVGLVIARALLASSGPTTENPGNYFAVNEAPALAGLPNGRMLLFFDKHIKGSGMSLALCGQGNS
jgi:hypothetical protein